MSEQNITYEQYAQQIQQELERKRVEQARREQEAKRVKRVQPRDAGSSKKRIVSERVKSGASTTQADVERYNKRLDSINKREFETAKSEKPSYFGQSQESYSNKMNAWIKKHESSLGRNYEQAELFISSSPKLSTEEQTRAKEVQDKLKAFKSTSMGVTNKSPSTTFVSGGNWSQPVPYFSGKYKKLVETKTGYDIITYDSKPRFNRLGAPVYNEGGYHKEVSRESIKVDKSIKTYVSKTGFESGQFGFSPLPKEAFNKKMGEEFKQNVFSNRADVEDSKKQTEGISWFNPYTGQGGNTANKKGFYKTAPTLKGAYQETFARGEVRNVSGIDRGGAQNVRQTKKGTWVRYDADSSGKKKKDYGYTLTNYGMTTARDSDKIKYMGLQKEAKIDEKYYKDFAKIKGDYKKEMKLQKEYSKAKQDIISKTKKDYYDIRFKEGREKLNYKSYLISKDKPKFIIGMADFALRQEEAKAQIITKDKPKIETSYLDDKKSSQTSSINLVSGSNIMNQISTKRKLRELNETYFDLELKKDLLKKNVLNKESLNQIQSAYAMQKHDSLFSNVIKSRKEAGLDKFELDMYGVDKSMSSKDDYFGDIFNKKQSKLTIDDSRKAMYQKSLDRYNILPSLATANSYVSDYIKRYEKLNKDKLELNKEANLRYSDFSSSNRLLINDFLVASKEKNKLRESIQKTEQLITKKETEVNPYIAEKRALSGDTSSQNWKNTFEKWKIWESNKKANIKSLQEKQTKEILEYNKLTNPYYVEKQKKKRNILPDINFNEKTKLGERFSRNYKDWLSLGKEKSKINVSDKLDKWEFKTRDYSKRYKGGTFGIMTSTISGNIIKAKEKKYDPKFTKSEKVIGWTSTALVAAPEIINAGVSWVEKSASKGALLLGYGGTAISSTASIIKTVVSKNPASVASKAVGFGMMALSPYSRDYMETQSHKISESGYKGSRKLADYIYYDRYNKNKPLDEQKSSESIGRAGAVTAQFVSMSIPGRSAMEYNKMMSAGLTRDKREFGKAAIAIGTGAVFKGVHSGLSHKYSKIFNSKVYANLLRTNKGTALTSYYGGKIIGIGGQALLGGVYAGSRIYQSVLAPDTKTALRSATKVGNELAYFSLGSHAVAKTKFFKSLDLSTQSNIADFKHSMGGGLGEFKLHAQSVKKFGKKMGFYKTTERLDIFGRKIPDINLAKTTYHQVSKGDPSKLSYKQLKLFAQKQGLWQKKIKTNWFGKKKVDIQESKRLMDFLSTDKSFLSKKKTLFEFKGQKPKTPRDLVIEKFLKTHSKEVYLKGSKVGGKTIKGFRDVSKKDYDIHIKSSVSKTRRDLLKKDLIKKLNKIDSKLKVSVDTDKNYFLKDKQGKDVVNLVTDNIVNKKLVKHEGMTIESRESWIQDKYNLYKSLSKSKTEGIKLSKTEILKMAKAKKDIFSYEKMIGKEKFKMNDKGYTYNVDVKKGELGKIKWNEYIKKTYKQDLTYSMKRRHKEFEVYENKPKVMDIVDNNVKRYRAVRAGSGDVKRSFSPTTLKKTKASQAKDDEFYTNQHIQLIKTIANQIRGKTKHIITVEHSATQSKISFADGTSIEAHNLKPISKPSFNLYENILATKTGTGRFTTKGSILRTKGGTKRVHPTVQADRYIEGIYRDTGRVGKDMARWANQKRNIFYEATATKGKATKKMRTNIKSFEKFMASQRKTDITKMELDAALQNDISSLSEHTTILKTRATIKDISSKETIKSIKSDRVIYKLKPVKQSLKQDFKDFGYIEKNRLISLSQTAEKGYNKISPMVINIGTEVKLTGKKMLASKKAQIQLSKTPPKTNLISQKRITKYKLIILKTKYAGGLSKYATSLQYSPTSYKPSMYSAYKPSTYKSYTSYKPSTYKSYTPYKPSTYKSYTPYKASAYTPYSSYKTPYTSYGKYNYAKYGKYNPYPTYTPYTTRKPFTSGFPISGFGGGKRSSFSTKSKKKRTFKTLDLIKTKKIKTKLKFL